MVNGSAVNVIGSTDAAQFLLNFSANGRNSTAHLDAHPAAVFMPDFDPGALETLLALGVSHNSRDLWAIFPKQSGNQPASTSQIQLATYPDEQGTFNGQPVAVHHLVATIAGATTDLFAGPDNQLLQAELPQQGFALIRTGFVLKPPTKPEPAPAPANQSLAVMPSALLLTGALALAPSRMLLAFLHVYVALPQVNRRSDCVACCGRC